VFQGQNANHFYPHNNLQHIQSKASGVQTNTVCNLGYNMIIELKVEHNIYLITEDHYDMNNIVENQLYCTINMGIDINRYKYLLLSCKLSLQCKKSIL